jgi:tRNA (guanine-N7-)-methyltransferase
MSSEPVIYRETRSFVRREGRLTAGQEKALAEHWGDYGLLLQDDAYDWAAQFGRTAPRVLEIGFGDGEALWSMAQRYPLYDFIGVEVHRPGIGHLLLRAAEAELSNIRVFCEDAVAVLRNCCADASLARVQIFFPDPWPKKRHHKRRLIQPNFVDLLATKLQAGGILHLATDWEPYAEHIEAVFAERADFNNSTGAAGANGQASFLLLERPATKYEQRGKRLGHRVQDMLYERL